jgi:3-(3-hydroxy-phenyl)propionate hydroxylase
MQRRNVIVVGAGPVGTVAALACARRGLSVTLLEAQARIDDSPRASTTQPPTLEILAELGLIDEYLRVGLVSRTFQFWDRPTLTLVAEFDFARLAGETAFPFVVQTEQHKLANMALAQLEDARMGTRVTGLSQDENGVRVFTEDQSYAADYVIGADGGRSTVRKSLGIAFEGYTWPERFLVITTRFDFQAALGCCLRNYMADPQEWTNLFKVAGDDLKGRWRAVYNTREDETDEEALSDAAVRARLSRIHVPESQRDYLHLNLYAVHQRVAQSFRKGRVFLCGDAAHVNNPIGGLGLNIVRGGTGGDRLIQTGDPNFDLVGSADATPAATLGSLLGAAASGDLDYSLSKSGLTFSAGAVERNGEIILLINRQSFFDQKRFHFASFRSGLMRYQIHPDHFFGYLTRFGGRFRQFYAAAFAAAAGVDLRLDDNDIGSQFPCRIFGFFRSCGHNSARNGNAECL